MKIIICIFIALALITAAVIIAAGRWVCHVHQGEPSCNGDPERDAGIDPSATIRSQCAWCGKTLRSGPSAAPLSHGMCQACATAERTRWRSHEQLYPDTKTPGTF